MTQLSRKPSARRSPRAPSEPATPGGQRFFSIRVTSRMTSIEPATLRVWERRYGFPRPERTDGGSRVYSGDDVETLKLIRLALDHGYRPSEVVGKPREEIAQMTTATARASPPESAAFPTVDTMIAAIAVEDAVALRAELRQAAVVLGAKRFVMEVAQPLAVKVGDLWERGKLEERHEHLATEHLSSQLQLLISAYDEREGAPRVLLATLPGERHGLGLEMVQLYLAVSRITPRNLGVDIPAEQIVKAARSQSADAVGLFVAPGPHVDATAKQVRWMLGELPRRVPVWIGGAAGTKLEIHDAALRLIATWSDLDAAIAGLSRSGGGALPL